LLANLPRKVTHRGEGLGSAVDGDPKVLPRGLEERTYIEGDKRLL
jgi:hypothetical protein